MLGDDPDTDLALLRVDAVAAARGHARRQRPAEARPDRDRDRQSARLRGDRDGRRRLGARPLAAVAHRADDRGRHADRRRAQSRQFRRPARLLPRRGHRHQHRDDHGRAGHLLRRRVQHRQFRRSARSFATAGCGAPISASPPATTPVPRRIALRPASTQTTGAQLIDIDQAAPPRGRAADRRHRDRARRQDR